MYPAGANPVFWISGLRSFPTALRLLAWIEVLLLLLEVGAGVYASYCDE